MFIEFTDVCGKHVFPSFLLFQRGRLCDVMCLLILHIARGTLLKRKQSALPAQMLQFMCIIAVSIFFC